jgi:hypothetical protein
MTVKDLILIAQSYKTFKHSFLYSTSIFWQIKTSKPASNKEIALDSNMLLGIQNQKILKKIVWKIDSNRVGKK